MQGKGRFYINGPVANDLEYNVTVAGVGEGVLRRLVYPETVRRVEVGAGEPGKVQGTLFLPEVPGPGVLCLSGAGGVRVSWRLHRSKLISQLGGHSRLLGWQRVHHLGLGILWHRRSSEVRKLSRW